MNPIDKFNAIVDAVESRCVAADGPVTPTLKEMREDELAALWQAVQEIRDELGRLPKKTANFSAEQIRLAREDDGRLIRLVVADKHGKLLFDHRGPADRKAANKVYRLSIAILNQRERSRPKRKDTHAHQTR